MVQKNLVKGLIGLFILAGLIVFILPLCFAEIQTLGVFKQNDCVNLKQICASCSYNNISSIMNPDSTLALISESEMTPNGIEYNYSFCDANQTGTYIVNGHGNLDGTDTIWNYDFDITFNGKEPPSGIVVVFFSLAFLIIIGFLSYLFIENIGHFGQMDYDLGDLIKNISLYFVLVGTYFLSLAYMGNEMIDTILVWIMGIAGFTNVAMSFLFFVICFLAKRKVEIQNAW